MGRKWLVGFCIIAAGNLPGCQRPAPPPGREEVKTQDLAPKPDTKKADLSVVPVPERKPLNHWLKLLESDKEEERLQAIQGVGEFGAAAKEAIPQLIEALRSKNMTIAIEAKNALAHIGADAVPALVKSLADFNVNGLAGQALLSSPQGLLALFDALNNENVYARVSAELALDHKYAEYPEVYAKLRPVLVEKLKDNNREVRLKVACLLARLERQGAEMAVPILIEGLKADNEPNLQIVKALGWIGPKAKEAVPALADTLRQSKDAKVRELAASTLGKIGWRARSAVPALLECIKDSNAELRAQAAIALVSIDPVESKAAIPVLIETAKNKRSAFRANAVLSLGAIGPEAKEAAPPLLEVLRDQDAFMRSCALTALAQFKLEAAAAMPALLEVLKDSDESVREKALVCLREYGRDAKPAVSQLIDLLDDKSAKIRTEAAATLGSIGPDAKSAIPALRELSNAAEAEVRRAAAEALKKVQMQ